jgi:hypothetical protein
MGCAGYTRHICFLEISVEISNVLIGGLLFYIEAFIILKKVQYEPSFILGIMKNADKR